MTDMQKPLSQGRFRRFARVPARFLAGLAKMLQTGGIVPSQRFLVSKMIAPVPPSTRGGSSSWAAAPAR